MDNSMEEEVGGEIMEESEGELSSDHGGEEDKEEEEKGLLNGRKRKRKTSTHHRRKLRSKYESVDDFNPEARTAQSEELERIRRLKLQQTLIGEADFEEAEEGEEGRAEDERRKSEELRAVRGESSTSSSAEVVVVDLTEMVEEEQKSSDVEAIVIDSGSESEDDHASKSGNSQPGSTRSSGRMEIDKLNRKYDWAEPCLDGRVLVNVGHGSGEDDVFLAPQVARVAKPHQIGGIRFLYDNIIESQSRFNTSTGFGCILAHSMGLGKTLQVIAFIDIFLRHTAARHVLCVVPVNTLQNWIAEFDCWLPIHPGEKGVVEFKTTSSRPTSRRGSPLETPESKIPSGSPLHPDNAAQLSVPTSGCSSSSSSSLRVPSPMEEPSIATLKSPSPSPAPVAPVPPNQGLLLSSLVSPSTQPNLQADAVADYASAGDVPVCGQAPHSEGSDNTMSDNTMSDTAYRKFKLFMLSEGVRTMDARLKVISQWRREGGVLLMGYEMYRLLALSVPSLGGNKMAVKKRKAAKNQQANHDRTTIDLEETEKEMDALIAVQQALCRPGPDLVICDEGHRIKNDVTNISQALKKIRTRRRIVMTGYPVQNNLQEYWCMVDFVRPNYLGTKHEFADLFERPITNGQCVDSTAADVRVMRFRSHVLHALLEGFVLRRGHEILNLTLPPKFEHMLYLRPSVAQATLYNYNIGQMQGMSASMNAGPLRAFAVCTKIWNHPDIYYTEAVARDSNRTSPTSWLDEAGLPKVLLSKSEPGSLCKIDWPSTALPNYQMGLLGNSPKMAVMMELINRSVMLGDRVLVFSQSLPTLSYVEKLLSQSLVPVPHSTSPDADGTVQLSDSKWIKGRNFCRLDGSTGSMERDRLINYFNSAANTECWVFLLSTRAGCLGVNLIGANRVIVLDVSWNPCYDTQAVCRVYRYGQVKPVFIYRLVCDGTMERKIYDRQVSKQGMSDRVVDELHPERHFTVNDIITLIAKLAPLSAPPDLSALSKFQFSDPVLVEVCKTHGHLFTKLPFKHESLLVSTDERLTDVEKYYALKGFQQDWKAMHSAPGQNYRTQQAARSQQSPIPRLPTVTTAVPRTAPAVTPQVVTNLQRMPTARVDAPTLLFPPANVSQRREGGGDVEVICLDSDSDEEGSSIGHVSSTGSVAADSPSDGTASQYVGGTTQIIGGTTQIIGGVSQSVGGAQKGSSPPIIMHQQRMLPSSSIANARASPLWPSSSLLPAGALTTIGSAGISSPSLATSPALAATIANILASAKGGAIRVGNVVGTHSGTTNRPPSSVSSSSFANPSSDQLGAHATQAALPLSIANLVQYSQQLSKLNHMRPLQGTESLAASPRKSSSQQRPRSVVDPLITVPSQPRTLSSNWQHMINDPHAQATSPSSAPTSTHGVSSTPTALPDTPIPLLSPIAAELFGRSAGSMNTASPFSSPTTSPLSSTTAPPHSTTVPPLSSVPTRMPTLVPLPSNSSSLSATVRKTAVVPPYFAVSSTSNTPAQPTPSQPQPIPSSNGITGHSQATISPELKDPVAADKGEANCESIVLGD